MAVFLQRTILACKQSIRGNIRLGLDSISLFVSTIPKLCMKLGHQVLHSVISINLLIVSTVSHVLTTPQVFLGHSAVKSVGVVEILHSQCIHGINHIFNSR